MSSVLSKKTSPDQEFQVLSAIITLPIPKLAKRFALNQVGYDNDKKIIELLIRTSLTIEELYSKLEALGYDYDNVNKNYIQVSECGMVCVPLQIGRNSRYIMIYGKIMCFNY
jgi:hypothetical protein